MFSRLIHPGFHQEAGRSAPRQPHSWAPSFLLSRLTDCPPSAPSRSDYLAIPSENKENSVVPVEE